MECSLMKLITFLASFTLSFVGCDGKSLMDVTITEVTDTDVCTETDTSTDVSICTATETAIDTATATE